MDNNTYRQCPCGRKIPAKHYLCRECKDIYGERVDWPEWLKFYVADMRREQRVEINEQINTRRAFYDVQAERLVSQRRSSLIESYDTQGSIILRGCEGGK